MVMRIRDYALYTRARRGNERTAPKIKESMRGAPSKKSSLQHRSPPPYIRKKAVLKSVKRKREREKEVYLRHRASPNLKTI